MRRLFLFILLAAGFVFVSEAYRTQTTDRENRLAAVTRILTTPGLNLAGIEQPPSSAGASSTLAQGVTVIATDLNSSAATAPLVAPATHVNSESAGGDAPRVAILNTEAAPIAVAAVSVPPPLPAWQSDIADTPSAIGMQAKPETMTRPALVRAIQSELKRVNCYRGPVDGSWGGRSKRALQAFMERVNASLPTQAPDLFQLTLIQSQQYPVCGDRCPRGQSLSRDGQCVPDSILARASKKQPAAELVANHSREANGPTPYSIAVGGQTSAITTGSTEVAAVEASRATREPLPGRMSVGAPVEATAPAAPTPAADARVAALDEGSEGGPWQAPGEAPGRAGSFEDYDPPISQTSAVAPTEDAEDTADDDRTAAAPRKNRKSATVLRPAARARAASKPQRPRQARFHSRAGRSVQSLFTNPLGR